MTSENPVLPEYPEIITMPQAIAHLLEKYGIKFPDAEGRGK